MVKFRGTINLAVFMDKIVVDCRSTVFELCRINILRLKFSQLVKKPQNQQKFSPLKI